MGFVRKLVLLVAVPMMALGQTNDEEQAEAPAPGNDFARYQTILERMPFGPEPPNFNPDAPPGSAAAAAAAAAANGEEEETLTEDVQQIVSAVRISVLNVTPSGAVAVGFTDSSVQPAANYYMKVGEKRDVWEVKEADPAEQTVVLVKNGVEAPLKVGEGAPPGGKGAKVSAGAGRPRMLPRHPQQQAAGNAPSGPQDPMARWRAQHANRRRSAEEMKAEEERREAAAAEARKEAAKAAAEREQQREALMQIQEELRRQREEKEQRAAQEAQERQQQETQSEEVNE